MAADGASLLDRLRGSRKWPPHWPIRWKLAAVSSGITFIILVAFGSAVGQITTNQLRENYAADTEAKVNELAAELRNHNLITPAYFDEETIVNGVLSSVSGAADVTSWANGIRYRLPNTHDLGPPTNPGISTSGGWQIATATVTHQAGAEPIVLGVVRYGRPMDRLNASIGRIWISILAGILGATLLAALGGVMLSRRAMRPVSSLTTAAGQIARTRDPDVNLPEPEGDDEVAELTRTFNDMLHELSIARTERERSFERQREFVADASHELKTPLTSVLANLELLDDALRRSDKPGDREFEIESVESALRSSQRMTRLVADLQILAKADAGRGAAPVACDMSEIAANVAAELKPICGNHNVVLDTPEPVVVSGNVDEIHRALLNLVDNAIRHTPPGSTIRVATRLDGDMAELRVEDDGQGIPPEMWPTIFDRFVRHSGPGDRARGKGTGLGLSIVRVIAHSHGGTATVGDSPDGGASFVIRIPIARSAPLQPAPPSPQGRITSGIRGSDHESLGNR